VLHTTNKKGMTMQTTHNIHSSFNIAALLPSKHGITIQDHAISQDIDGNITIIDALTQRTIALPAILVAALKKAPRISINSPFFAKGYRDGMNDIHSATFREQPVTIAEMSELLDLLLTEYAETHDDECINYSIGAMVGFCVAMGTALAQ
jgi:hypothetical protein